ncbi:UvrD-helicase domain-containing protein [Paenibacillus albicereus]|uniref:UvrD-helicase domain-containing protein n=1 Tax=Paenibacillus albicereus TaxID=2726185 RepID=A0A6H2GZA5_9BACL|nr:RNA polymerase recycling motor HelD [Paenibacillus albicereus]QJC52679.1 UvrD-helicase domain-containing protein [Paenibacillus albicereus]
MRNERDWNEERAWLERVADKLRERIAELEPEVAGLHGQAGDLRRRFWEEVTVNTATDEDFEETFYSIRQQEALLSERERSHRLRLQQWKSMTRLLPSPYFGRIDFREQGLSAAEPVYIGVSSFVDAKGMDFLVYDWRTPIASLYYDHSPGPAAYDTPDGTVPGVMELKRQYQIRQGRLLNVFDTSLTIGDELLQQALGQGADSQMKSIVATIQKEQNAIIRDDTSRMLLVQGAAGSGKTSAALQRVAYLLYKNRDRLKADQIVLFSPNPMFNSYVSTVLPELGEENMQQTTFQEYLEHGLGSMLHLEDPFDAIEYVLKEAGSREHEARVAGIRYKASGAFLQALRHYADGLGQAGMRFSGIRFRERELISASRMTERFYGYDPSIRLANRVAMLQEWLLKELAVLERKERGARWVSEELDYLDNDRYDAVHRELHKERGVFDFAEQYERIQEIVQNKRRRDEGDFDYAEREEELLAGAIVQEQFEPLRRSVKRMQFVDKVDLYAQLFASEEAYAALAGQEDVPELWPDICSQTREKLARGELFSEDATPFLYLRELVEGMRTNTQVRHVFVDEGQDYSMVQYEYLRKLFPRARMTVLGDFGQAIFTQATELDGEDSPLMRLYGEPDTRLIRLVRSYRSTREIVEFTKALLPSAREIVPFARSGHKPLLIQAADSRSLAARMAEDIAALQADGFASIAVITKTAAESREAHELLTAQGCPPLRLVTKETPTFENGTQVIPAYLAKGVEFDAVLIYDASSRTYHRESERKLFYTACTRAMHRLQLYAAGEGTPFLQGVEPSLYEREDLS